MYILVPLDITFIHSVLQVVYQFSICLIHNVKKVNQYFLHLTQKKRVTFKQYHPFYLEYSVIA
jgi:hypothetical protein